ncbi:hypothetical protein POX_e06557 [Penicillium oxalicum]|uniref:hypothetical protein n=1 Tax=Penicillium oxalicum TaxID=69781 RepID=UPI0020B8C3CA|nr:hypothetical protein POX_e06557 [Penicillium oxalicum]KAI2788539.1 hypothetical protein POX_e06557 [Penicillium oxalicum]
MPRRRGNKEYYAIVTGRVKEPTIYSSWGDAHPRITGCESKYKSCWTLQEARTYMERMGATKVKEVIKSGAGETTPLGGNGFYAVANGKRPGIYPFYYGENGAEKEVTEEKGSCHKRFRTMAQAEAFIEDWKETYAQIWHEIIKNALDRGHRPLNSDAFRPHKMGSIINLFLCEGSGCSEVDDITEITKSQLLLQDNRTNDKKTV